MNYEMKLKSENFNYIKMGTKRIELRLNDEKRSIIKIGDTITFLKEPEKVERIKTKVVGLLKYSSFEALMKDYSIDILADKNMTKQQLTNILQTFYTVEDQNKYGVLGIRIELL